MPITLIPYVTLVEFLHLKINHFLVERKFILATALPAMKASDIT
jgi:hypothetical protein